MADITFLGRTNVRQPYRTFGIRQDDRFSHIYIIGRTGVGKSTLLETMARQDIEAGRGVCIIDPHGDLAERLARSIPTHRAHDLRYFNVPDRTQPFGYNPLRRVHPTRIPLAVSGLMEAMKKLWEDAWGVRMEHVLRNTLYALFEAGNATLPDILRLIGDKEYRKKVIPKIKNSQVRMFWEDEFKGYSPRYRQDMIGPIQNKVGAFLADPILKRIFTEATEELSLRKVMDEGRILIVNLAKGRLGDDSANLLGALLVTTLGLAALSRGDLPEESRKPFFIYIDEFQSFTTLSVANMISELRKYRIGLTLAHQHLHQLLPDVRHAVLANAGTLMCFRVGAEDAPLLGREFEGVATPLDLMNLPNREVLMRLMIDGTPSRPFSASMLHPDHVPPFTKRIPPIYFGTVVLQ